MNLKQLLFAKVLIASFAFQLAAAIGQTRLGLHVTQEELNIWKQRAGDGPYKIKGDVSPNSPGDWMRIQSNANAFLLNPSGERWSGQTTGACWWADRKTTPLLPGRSRGEKLRDAAFSYLVTGNVKYRDAVRSELLAQSETPGSNFADGTRWCNNPPIGDSHSHEIVMWLTKILFGYDYIRSSLSDVDRTRLEAWFRSAGSFWETVVRTTLKKRFPNRDKDDYATLGPGWDPANPVCSHGKCVTHYDGWKKYDWHEGWNNRNAAQIRFATLVGILTNDAFLKNQGKKYFKESLKYSVFPDGTHADFRRWTDTKPGLGWHYAGTMLGSLVNIADHFARAGDPELYQFSSSEGLFGTQGGPKSLDKAIKLFLGHVNRTVVRYGTSDPAKNGNPTYLVSSVDSLSREARVHDTYMAPANLFYKDSFVRSIYTRSASGAPPYPATPSNSGEGSAWGGEWNVYPGILFMFGMMEGKVSPYSAAPAGPASSALVAPTLRAVSK
jgi:hypothetical protein